MSIYDKNNYRTVWNTEIKPKIHILLYPYVFLFYFFSEEGVSPGVQLAFASMMGETHKPLSSEEEEEEEEGDTLSYVDDEDDEDYKVNEVEEEKLEVEEKVKKRKGGRGRRKKKEEYYDDYDEEEDPSVGDVFALEMKLNRENKKMMKVRRERLASFDVVSQH